MNDISLNNKKYFLIFLFIIIISSMGQGLLMPLLAILLEESGISSSANGINATALYIGIFAAMLFVEKPIQKYRFKIIFLVSFILVTMSIFSIMLWQHWLIWFVLRLFVGLGDGALQYTAQLWVGTDINPKFRGTYLAFYGMVYSIGFSIGPLLINLLKWGNNLPLIAITLLNLVALTFIFLLPNVNPKVEIKKANKRNNYSLSIRLAWFAIFASFLYGYMESTLNTNFPIYALNYHIPNHWISIILTSVGVGTLIFQLPLGWLSDKYNRKTILMITSLFGAIGFLLVPLFNDSVIGILIILLIIGGLLGSFYTLGLAYTVDLLPANIFPSANVLITVLYSLGSMFGPSLSGVTMQLFSANSMFILLGSVFLLFTLSGFWFRKEVKTRREILGKL